MRTMAITDEMIRAGLQGEIEKGGPPDDLWHLVEQELAARRRSASHRRRASFLSVAAAALAAVLTVTYFGPGTVLAAADKTIHQVRNWVASNGGVAVGFLTPEEAKKARETPPAPSHDYTRMPLGNELAVPSPGVRDGRKPPEHTVQALTVADLASLEPSWPLPTYLAPPPDQRVGLDRFYDSSGKVTFVSLQTSYPIPGKGPDAPQISFHLYRNLWAAGKSGAAESPEDGQVRGHLLVPEMQPTLKTEAVTVKGQPALAWGDGSEWTVAWSTSYGQGSITAHLPLAEVLKVAESLPALQ